MTTETKASRDPFIAGDQMACGCSCKHNVSGYRNWTRCSLHAAAPELLEACKDALAFVAIATCEHANQNEQGRINAQNCVDLLKSAIAKAEGEMKS